MACFSSQKAHLPNYQITHLPILPSRRQLLLTQFLARCQGAFENLFHAQHCFVIAFGGYGSTSPPSAYALDDKRSAPVGKHWVGGRRERIAFGLQAQQGSDSHHGSSGSPGLGAGSRWILHRKARLGAL